MTLLNISCFHIEKLKADRITIGTRVLQATTAGLEFQKRLLG